MLATVVRIQSSAPYVVHLIKEVFLRDKADQNNRLPQATAMPRHTVGSFLHSFSDMVVWYATPVKKATTPTMWARDLTVI